MIDREIAASSGEARIDALLRDAASFVPEHAAPGDLCSRELCNKAIIAPERPRRFTLLAAGGGAVAALAALSVACALRFVNRPTAMLSPQASIRRAVIPPAAETVAPIAPTVHDRATPTMIAAHREPRRLRPVRHGRSAIRHELAASLRDDAFVLPSPHRQARPQIAAITAQPVAPAKSCWTTEDVQETKYVLVSPGIVTDGSGDSERATPVLVQLPIANGDEIGSDLDEPESVAGSTTTH